MNTNTQSENNKIDINNMFKILALFDLGPPELEASSRSVAPVEEIVADLSAASLFEAQDDALFALKHTQESLALYSKEEEAAENIKIPRKRLKTFHEHPIPEPMDICTSESESSEKWMYSCCANCVLTDGQMPSRYCRRAYPDLIIDSDSDEDREIDEYDPIRTFRPTTSVEEDVEEEDEYLTELWILEQEAKRRYPRRSNTVDDKNDAHHGFRRADTVDDEIEMELWILEQEAKRRYPRRSRPEGLEEIAVRLFEDEPEELIMPILEEEEALPIPPMPVLRRQNTQFTVNGVTVYNGNPNGSRFFDDYDEYWDVLRTD